jgi:hypothetical protein
MGMRPIVDVQYGDFLFLAMDQIVNNAAKMHYMSGGTVKVPMVMRAPIGATGRESGRGLAIRRVGFLEAAQAIVSGAQQEPGFECVRRELDGFLEHGNRTILVALPQVHIPKTQQCGRGVRSQTERLFVLRFGDILESGREVGRAKVGVRLRVRRFHLD